MCLSITLAIVAITGFASIPFLIVLALCIGTVNAVDMPVRQSFAVEMVGREDIGNAVALNSAMFNSARVIGPAVAGLVIGAVGVAAAFVIDAASFLAVIAALLAMRETELHPAARIERPESFGAVMTQLREGLGYVRTTPVVLIAVLVVALVGTVGMNFTVIIPPYAEGVLDSDAAGYGFLMAASGVGSLLAALWLAFGDGTRIRRIGYGRADPRHRRDRPGRVAVLPGLVAADGRCRLRRDPDGDDRQHDDAAGRAGRAARPGHERLHDGLRRARPRSAGRSWAGSPRSSGWPSRWPSAACSRRSWASARWSGCAARAGPGRPPSAGAGRGAAAGAGHCRSAVTSGALPGRARPR